MKLLFDQNISNRILPKLLAEFPTVSHIKIETLENATDYEIFMYARKNSYEGVIICRYHSLVMSFKNNSPAIWVSL